VGGVSLPVVILGIDPARSSGWALWASGHIDAFGVCGHARDRQDAVRLAQHAAADLDYPLVIVYERHTVGGGARWNPETMMGMGEARGRWLEQLELAGVKRSHVIGVTPGTWRRAALGASTGRMQRDGLKALAVQSCKARGYPVTNDDEAEAILIALWGAQASAEVRQLATRKRRAA
jgi:hypothetical protein